MINSELLFVDTSMLSIELLAFGLLFTFKNKFAIEATMYNTLDLLMRLSGCE